MKTGYGVAMDLMENGTLGKRGRGSTSVKSGHAQVWNSIWALEVPNKMKFFVWKCCNHALAVRRNLKRRHMRVDNVCGVCGQMDETENHIFFRCETSHQFWVCSSLHLNSFGIEGSDFMQSWTNFCKRIEKAENKHEILREFVFGLWRLWKNRNCSVFTQGGSRLVS